MKFLLKSSFLPFTVIMWFVEPMYKRMDLDFAVKSEVREVETFFLVKVNLFKAVLENESLFLIRMQIRFIFL